MVPQKGFIKAFKDFKENCQTTLSKKTRMYAKNISTKIFEIFLKKPEFLGATNDLNSF